MQVTSFQEGISKISGLIITEMEKKGKLERLQGRFRQKRAEHACLTN